MEIITILNKCYKHKGFVYKNTRFSKSRSNSLEIEVVARKNSRPICSKCSTKCPGYDKLPIRSFEFIPFWGYHVFLVYKRRRVNCLNCGITAEYLPWSDGKNHLTKVYMQYLAHWAKKLSWKDVAVSFNTSWDKVFKSIEYIVSWGLKQRDLSGITAIGVDEIIWKKGHRYLSLVYQINKGCVRLLWIGQKRTVKSFSKFFILLGPERTADLEFICSDMWKPYLKVIREQAGHALNILDRFHIVARLNKALDKVRAGEHRKMKEEGYDPLLTKSRWLLLKRPENLTSKQEIKLSELIKYNLKSIRAYLLKEDFQQFWNYTSPKWAGKFLDNWTTRVMRSKIEPFKKEAKTLRKHKPLILNWFVAKKAFSSGIVEGLNNKVKLTLRKSYGFRTFECTEIALYHTLGKLPEPKLTHKFY